MPGHSACERQQNIRLIGGGRGCDQIHLGRSKTDALSDHHTQVLGAVIGFQQAGGQCERQGIDIADTVTADETIFGENLGKIKISLGRVEIRQLGLILVRHIGIKSPRLQSLHIFVAKQIPLALKSDSAVYTQQRQSTRGVCQCPGIIFAHHIIRAV